MWYIFRHGETFDNLRKDRVMGHTKHIYLTYNGILQTYLNGLKLLKTKEDFTNYRFICSPLERADHTCQLLLDTIGLRFDKKEQEYLLSIKNGLFLKGDGSLRKEFYDAYSELEKEVDYVTKHTVLPEHPDYAKIEDFLMSSNMATVLNQYNTTEKILKRIIGEHKYE